MTMRKSQYVLVICLYNDLKREFLLILGKKPTAKYTFLVNWNCGWFWYFLMPFYIIQILLLSLKCVQIFNDCFYFPPLLFLDVNLIY